MTSSYLIGWHNVGTQYIYVKLNHCLETEDKRTFHPLLQKSADSGKYPRGWNGQMNHQFTTTKSCPIPILSMTQASDRLIE